MLAQTDQHLNCILTGSLLIIIQYWTAMLINAAVRI